MGIVRPSDAGACLVARCQVSLHGEGHNLPSEVTDQPLPLATLLISTMCHDSDLVQGRVLGRTRRCPLEGLALVCLPPCQGHSRRIGRSCCLSPTLEHISKYLTTSQIIDAYRLPMRPAQSARFTVLLYVCGRFTGAFRPISEKG